MADPFAQLGISRRPANVLFGTPDVSAGALGGWSDAAVQSAAEDQAAQEEYQAAQDRRAAQEDARAEAARKRAAEDKVDQMLQMPELSARQKFLETEGPAMAASPRYNEVLRHQQQFEPSYADQRLANTVAMKIADPEARQIFHEAVAAGHGTLAARDMADTFMAKRMAAGELGKAGYSPDEAEALVAERHDPAHVNFHIAQKKEGTMFHRDPQAQALEKYYHVLKDRAAAEKASLTGGGEPSSETMTEMKLVTDALGQLYKAKSPLATSPAAVVPTTSAEAKKSLLSKMGLLKPTTP